MGAVIKGNKFFRMEYYKNIAICVYMDAMYKVKI